MFRSQVSSVILFGLLAISFSYEIKTVVENGIPNSLKTDPFLRIGNGLYYIEPKLELNWFAANVRCHEMDSELVTFETIEEWDLVTKYLTNKNIVTNYWTSGCDLAERFKHVWFTTGQPIIKDIWAPGEPNNSRGNEQCDELLGNRNLRLNDRPCAAVRRFICERRQLTTVSIAIW